MGRSKTLFVGDGELGFDPAVAVEHVRQSDRALARVIDRVGPLRLQVQHTTSVFGALAEAIVYQQLSPKAAATIFGRVCALVPQSPAGPAARPLLRVSDAKLRGAGLSRSKALSLQDLARKAVGGEIPTLAEMERLDDEAIIERLIEVRGIGRWTAQMFLIFRLGRPDVLAVDDYGLRRGLGAALRRAELPTREALERRGKRWRPYRSVASWYLWRANEMKGKAPTGPA
jgi:3-methyladenine DNA glycosylase/8-oxoguanine DNA glycosylase